MSDFDAPSRGEPVLRRATRADDDALHALFVESFPASPKANAAVTRWQYWDNPFGDVQSWVFEDGGRIVAHYAGMPVPLMVNGRTATGAIGIDAATVPSHRGRGLFEQLARKVYDECEASAVAAVLCFPNANSKPGFVKAGGSLVGEMRTYVFATSSTWLARRFRVPEWVAAPALRTAFRARSRSPIEEVRVPPDDLDDLWARAAPSGASGVRRDHAWWQWRYVESPSDAYRFFLARSAAGALMGCAAVIQREEFGGRFTTLLELLADGDGARESLIAGIARAIDADGVVTVALAGSPQASGSRSAGMRALPRRLAPKPLFFGVAGMDPAEAERARWNIVWGDLDHL